jgi:phosphohistidine phosphatase
MLAAELGVQPQLVREEGRLYASSAGNLLHIIQEQDDDRDCLMLVGHNPEMSELAQHFSREMPEMPTAAVARIDVDVESWALVGSTTPASAVIDFPKKGHDRVGED